MVRQFASRFLDEIDATVPVGALVLVGFGVLADLEAAMIAILLGIVAGVPVARAVVDAAETDSGPGIAAIVFGSFVATAGAYSGLNGDPWLGAALGLVGAWLGIDGIARRRYGDGIDTDDADDNLSKAEFADLHDANRVLVTELRAADRPLSADEIRSRTGLSAETVDRLLELHGDTGPVDRIDDGYAIDEAELGIVGFARYLGRTIGGRILRPLRLFRTAG